MKIYKIIKEIIRFISVINDFKTFLIDPNIDIESHINFAILQYLIKMKYAIHTQCRTHVIFHIVHQLNTMFPFSINYGILRYSQKIKPKK